MLSTIILSIVMLNVIMMSVIMLSVVMISVIMLNAVSITLPESFIRSLKSEKGTIFSFKSQREEIGLN